MQPQALAQSLMLRDLQIVSLERDKKDLLIHCASNRPDGVCPRCAKVCTRVYDRREIVVRDASLRRIQCRLHINKRRFQCECGKVFTEFIEGIRVKSRCTERFKRECVQLAKEFTSLSAVCVRQQCSNGFLYKALYEALHTQARHHCQQRFPKAVGLDEHSFKRGKYGRMKFVTVLVSPTGQKRRLLDVTQGKSSESLWNALGEHQGREDVQLVVLDMSKAYRKFAREFFVNAKRVADKFHVIRLLAPVVMKYRYAVTAKRADKASRAMMLRDFKKLDYGQRNDLRGFLSRHEDLSAVWQYYQAIMVLYRCRGRKRAEQSFDKIIDKLSKEKLKELKRLRRTLLEWKDEILNYFTYRITNARCEGFNNKAKVLKKRAYGYKNFENYRLRILTT